MKHILEAIFKAKESGDKLLAVLIDPDKFLPETAEDFLRKIPSATTHIFVGGSTDEKAKTGSCIEALKLATNLPVVIFPGDYQQISEAADAILFLSLLSGRNAEYLIGQQLKAVPYLRDSRLEIIPTAYILVDGGKECAVQRVSGTKPLPQNCISEIVDTALAGFYTGKKLIYLEAGSGALKPVSSKIISAVKEAVKIPLIVGGGIRSVEQLEESYRAGADLVVIGTAFEDGSFELQRDLKPHRQN